MLARRLIGFILYGVPEKEWLLVSAVFSLALNLLCYPIYTQHDRTVSDCVPFAVLTVRLLFYCRMLKDLKDMETLSELGVLFLLYEQGLELSLDRLKVRNSSGWWYAAGYQQQHFDLAHQCFVIQQQRAAHKHVIKTGS